MKTSIAIVLATSLLPWSGFAGPIALDRPVSKSLRPNILYFSFDQIVVNTVVDDSGNVADGEIMAGTFELPTSAPGVHEGAKGFKEGLQLAGGPKVDSGDRNPFVFVASADHLNLSDRDFTMGVWIKLHDDQSTALEVISKGISGSNLEKDAGYTFSLNREARGTGNWRLVFQTRDGLGNKSTRETPYVLPLIPGEWYHIGLSFEQERRIAGFWFNGERVFEAEMPTPIGQGTEMLVVGERRSSRYFSEFNGSLDDLFISEGVSEFGPVPAE